MTVPHLTEKRMAEHHRFRARLTATMRKRDLRRHQVAEMIGVTPTMVGYWTQGRYLPSLEKADALATALDDGVLRDMVKAATWTRCLVCPRQFARDRTRRLYCSIKCQRDYHKGVRGAPATDFRQKAIDEFCRGCEPEGLCRDEECALRAFSPLPFIPLHRVRSA